MSGKRSLTTADIDAITDAFKGGDNFTTEERVRLKRWLKRYDFWALNIGRLVIGTLFAATLAFLGIKKFGG